VAIGDISAVRPNEWVANALFEGISWFIYCALYADITLLVSNAASASYKNYMQQRNALVTKLKSPEIPVALLDQATLYVDYDYQMFQGVAQSKVLS
jgi:precorrin-3B methylase